MVKIGIIFEAGEQNVTGNNSGLKVQSYVFIAAQKSKEDKAVNFNYPQRRTLGNRIAASKTTKALLMARQFQPRRRDNW
jgi:hypothetical protein